MNKKDIICKDNIREERLTKSSTLNGNETSLNGIDYIEVKFLNAEKSEIIIHFFNDLKPPLKPELKYISNYKISGGVRYKNIKIIEIKIKTNTVILTTNSTGDFSYYLLEIYSPDSGSHTTLDGLDYIYSKKYFSFKAGCPSSFDCKKTMVCDSDEEKEKPIIDYMAKDYHSFRQVLIDYLYQKIPQWNENSEADLGIALIDLMSYVGDNLSYYQDAVANEMYFETARKRISVRRHARLIDYHIHEGNSARTFIHINTKGIVELKEKTLILSRIQSPLSSDDSEYKSPPHDSVINSKFERQALEVSEKIFETITKGSLHEDLNNIKIYTWGNKQCFLPKGATSAYLELDNKKEKLKIGDFLLFEEIIGSETGLEADADISRRQIVRLIDVKDTCDKLFKDNNNGKKLTYISWDSADALKFPLCLSIKKEDNYSNEDLIENISIARGNIVLADYGQTISNEEHTTTNTATNTPLCFTLKKYPLSFSIPISDKHDVPVQELMNINACDAFPQIINLKVTPSFSDENWKPMRDLLDCGPFDPYYVVEKNNEGQGIIRFGDNRYGLRPLKESVFNVTYKIGVGEGGNLGVDSLVHIIYDNPEDENEPSINFVRNPIPAWGGVDPESIEKVKLIAPKAFHSVQCRAVTEKDYAEKMQLHPQVSKAVATFRWTGSWYTIFITVDPKADVIFDDNYKKRLTRHITQFKLAGYDIEIQKPIYIPIELEIIICVDRNYFCEHIKKKVQEVLSNKILPNGMRGFFHPDNLTFGQSIFLSQIYKTIEEIEGVSSAQVVVFKRYGFLEQNELKKGFLLMDRLEIARLDNNPNFPENGKLNLIMMGGR
jgi:hypothetical protein